MLVENMGTHLSIDETSIDHVVYVFLTNKDGHGKKHTLIAYVKGLKVSDIVTVLMQNTRRVAKGRYGGYYGPFRCNERRCSRSLS